MKIEPMSVEDIKENLRLDAQYDSTTRPYNLPMRRLILAWAHERARANESDFHIEHDSCVFDDCARIDKIKHHWGPFHFRDAVLDSIGWPKDQR
jgi:hypothetical protein